MPWTSIRYSHDPTGGTKDHRGAANAADGGARDLSPSAQAKSKLLSAAARSSPLSAAVRAVIAQG